MKNLGFDNDQNQVDLFDMIKSGEIEYEFVQQDDGTGVFTTQKQYSFPYIFPHFKCMTWVVMFLDEYKLLTNDNDTDVERVTTCPAVKNTDDGRARNWTNNK